MHHLHLLPYAKFGFPLYNIDLQNILHNIIGQRRQQVFDLVKELCRVLFQMLLTSAFCSGDCRYDAIDLRISHLSHVATFSFLLHSLCPHLFEFYVGLGIC